MLSSIVIHLNVDARINLQQVLILTCLLGLLIVKGAEVEVKTSYTWNHVKTVFTEAEHLPSPMISRVVRESHVVMLMTGCPVGSKEMTSSFHFWVSCEEPQITSLVRV
jgi:hypothetical protein